MFTPRVNSKKVEPQNFQGARFSRFNTPKVYLLGVTKEAKENYINMKTLVNKWMLSKYEQEARQTVPYIFRWFSPQVNTTGPLVAASIATREAQDSAINLNDEVDSFNEKCSFSQKKICEIGGDLDQLVTSVSEEVISKALSKDQEGYFTQIFNFFDNKKEASPTFREKEKLVKEAVIWNTLNSCDELLEESSPRRSSSPFPNNDLQKRLSSESVAQRMSFDNSKSPRSDTFDDQMASGSPAALLRLSCSPEGEKQGGLENGGFVTGQKRRETRRWSILPKLEVSPTPSRQTSAEGQKSNGKYDNIRQNLKLKEEALLRNQATWNVYSRVAVNMALTAGVVGGTVYLARNSGWYSR